MPSSKPFARIAITLPESELAAADRLAISQDRSRSWVIAEAIRFYAATIESHAAQTAVPIDPRLSRFVTPPLAARAVVNEAIVSVPAPEVHNAAPESPGLDATHTLQLEREMALSPEQRVLIGERALQATSVVSDGPRFRAFETFAEYAQWKSRSIADPR